MIHDLRSYLDFVLPWDDPSQPKYVAAKILPKGMIERGFYNPASMAAVIENFSHNQRRDVWVAVHSLQPAVSMVQVSNGIWEGIKRGRDHVAKLQVLYTDVDVKAGGYQSLDEIRVAIENFCDAIGFPRPSLYVGSGNGVHVYWRLLEPINIVTWQQLSDRLASAMRSKQHEVLADHNVTVDASRILRPPGTWNFKDPQNPKPVGVLPGGTEQSYSLSMLTQALSKFPALRVATAGGKNLLSPQDQALVQGFTGGLDIPIDLHAIASECPMLAHEFATGGAQSREPLWNNIVLASTFDIKGEETCFELSRGHPDYSLQGMLKKYAEKEKAKAEKGTGWPSCQTFFTSGSAHCQTCPHLAAGKSPLNLHVKVQLAAPVTPQFTPPPGVPPLPLANGMRHEADGRVSCFVADAKGGQGMVYIPIQWPIKRVGLAENGDFVMLCDSKFGEKWVTIPKGASSAAEVTKALVEASYVEKIHHPKVDRYFVGWRNHLKGMGPTVIVKSTSLGWDDEGGFTFNKKRWLNGVAEPALIRAEVPGYGVKGSPDPWRTMIAIINRQNNPGLNCLVAASFGSPLGALTSTQSTLFATWSPGSGVGKSTAIHGGAGVWGSPTQTISLLNDTANAVSEKIATIHCLPAYHDELLSEPEKFVQQVMRLSGGREKARLDRNSTQKETRTFNSLLISATNKSLLETMMEQREFTDAGALRVLEVLIDKTPANAAETRQLKALMLELETNYGHAGEAYAEWLSANRDFARTILNSCLDYVEKALNLTQEHRFYAHIMGIILAGARIANMIGLTQFDLNSMATYLLHHAKSALDEITIVVPNVSGPEKVSDVISTMLIHLQNRHMYVTDVLSTVGNSTMPKPQGDMSRITEPWAQLAVGPPATLRVMVPRFKAYLSGKVGSPKGFVRNLIFNHWATETWGQVGVGIMGAQGVSSGRIRCMDIDLTAIQAAIPKVP